MNSLSQDPLVARQVRACSFRQLIPDAELVIGGWTVGPARAHSDLRASPVLLACRFAAGTSDRKSGKDFLMERSPHIGLLQDED
jgi:hypothetical protein